MLCRKEVKKVIEIIKFPRIRAIIKCERKHVCRSSSSHHIPNVGSVLFCKCTNIKRIRNFTVEFFVQFHKGYYDCHLIPRDGT